MNPELMRYVGGLILIIVIFYHVGAVLRSFFRRD